MTIIHIPAPGFGRTLCGRSMAKASIQVLRQNQAVDEATCRVCHAADDRIQVAAHRQSIGDAALHRACGKLTGEERALVNEQPDWVRIAAELAGRVDEEDLEQAILHQIRRWLARMVERAKIVKRERRRLA